MLEIIYKKHSMQYNMCKGSHCASSKKMEGSVSFHKGFSS